MFLSVLPVTAQKFSVQPKPEEKYFGKGGITFTVDKKALMEESAIVDKELKAHPQGYVLIIIKSSHSLYLAKDGKVVEGEVVKRSELDKDIFGGLAGKPEDETMISFPAFISLSPVSGKKEKRDDMKTPEGNYFVCRKNAPGETNYTVALELNYPNKEDAETALKEGKISKAEYEKIAAAQEKGLCPPQDTGLGSEIKIHGLSNYELQKWQKTPQEICFDEDSKQCRTISFEEWIGMEDVLGVITASDWTLGCVAAELSPLFYLYKTVPLGTPVIIYP